ncbi:DNA-3-methyladenine glycosylase 2 family protein [Vibrio navarrensis]
MAISGYSPLTTEQCQQARMARDSRFDGLFYVAVKTTRIFCRPVCPANLPKEENVEYYSDRTQALDAGYRPCLRCRPESHPGSWAWKGVETTFQRALHLIDSGALQQHSLTELAQRLGVSDRYVRQLFSRYLGIAPKQYAQYQQLMFAKQLLHMSNLSITDIGFAAGFNSTRRFNDAFKKVIQLTPSQVRREVTLPAGEQALIIPFQGALNWSHMLNFYRLRAIEGVEQVDENSYSRFVDLAGARAWFRVQKTAEQQMTVWFRLDDVGQLHLLVKKVRQMLDLNCNTDNIERHLQLLAPGLVKQAGIRIPGVWNAWEAGVRAILGQQVSVKAAIGQLNLLVRTLMPEPSERCFPTPLQLAQANLDFLRMPQSRKETLHRFAGYVQDNPDADPETWLALKGIGPWTVSYAQLRGESRPDCFLDKDLVVKKALLAYPQLNAKTASPWGSYATFHLWNQ